MKSLDSLIENISSHEAVNNKFYEMWLSQTFSLEKLAIFARNYAEWTHSFPKALATLISIVDDNVAQAEYTKTLFSEMGNGTAKRVHSILFEDFCNQLSIQLGKPNYLGLKTLSNNFALLPETTALIEWEKRIYSTDEVIATGGQLALELQAFTMIAKLYDGVRNYKNFWKKQDDFHAACEFFYVHIGETEKEHQEESIIATKEFIKRGADFDKIKLGFETHLLLIANFWNAIANNMRL